MISISNQEIMAGWETLLMQSHMTASEYLSYAIDNIDKRLGKGYAAKHPELLAAMIAAASADFNAASINIAAQKIRDAIENWPVASDG